MGDDSEMHTESPVKVNNSGDHSKEMNGISARSEHSHKDKDRHKSDKDKHRHSSSKSSHKDKDRDREHRDKDREHHKEKERENKDKDKEHKEHRDKDRHKEHKSSSRDKDRHSSSSKHSSSSHKDKDRHSSSSSHRDKDKERDKHHSLSKDKHNSSSSSSGHKDKDKHHSSSKDKDRHKERKEHGDKLKEKKDDGKHSFEYNKIVEVKIEPEPEHVTNAEIQSADSCDDTEKSLHIDEQEIKQEDEISEDETPLSMRDIKRKAETDEDEDDVPLTARVKKLKREDSEDEYKPEKKHKKRKSRVDTDDDEEDFKPDKKKKQIKKEVKNETTLSPKKGKKQEEEQEVWKWWEEEKRNDGSKWKFLEHKGPMFAPAYERLPSNVKFYYDGKEMRLSEDAEEVATFYAKMLSHDYTTKETFNQNFFKDWRKTMTEKEKAIIRDLKKCNFKEMHEYFNLKSEERKAMSKEEKKKIKEENDAIQKEYGFCNIDGHVEKIGNFRIEPPGLFRGRGEHPKMGMHKHRILPEDIIINCSQDSAIPKAPHGHKWKKVQHDSQVTWLASWIENIQGNVKYIMLNPSSKLKGEKDMMKYETARKLAKKIDRIRETYQNDWKSKEMRIRQRAVALYFIDRLALRAGNEKDEDQADTVGCCSLRVEHVSLHDQLNDKECVVVFDFLGKDSIRYYNEVPVEKRVFKNLKLFMENKKPGDDLFDRLNTTVLNKHLNELMDGLTAKVFRTYNASYTLQTQLDQLTDDNMTIPEKILAYNRANRAVAILCNHQRSVPKSHEKSMENLKGKIEQKREMVDEAKTEYKRCKKSNDKVGEEKAKKKLERLKEQLLKLELQETDKEENKTIALGTSKLNYLDPRISVAWCKKHGVPIEKIYNKTQRDKFRWAIDMAGPDYVF